MAYPRYIKNWKTSINIGVQLVEGGPTLPLQAKVVTDLTEIHPAVRWDTLDAARAERLAQIETMAAEKRSAIVEGADASMLSVYQQKYDIALTAIAGDGAALLALAAEAAIRGTDAATLAVMVKAKGDQWRAAGMAIEAARAAHKGAVLALADIAATEAYDVTSGWPA